MSPRTLMLFISLIAAASPSSAQTPPGGVYKLLFSPTMTGPGSQPTTMVEAAPNFFDFLSFGDSNIGGSTIWTVTSSGKSNEIYSFHQPRLMSTFVEATNGDLWGVSYPNHGPGSYLTLSPTGKNAHQFTIPNHGGGTSTLQAIDGLCDLIGYPNNGSEVFVFSHISYDGTIQSLHELTSSDGRLLGSNLAYGPDGNVYGLATVSNSLQDPSWIFRLTPQGQYSRIAQIQPPFAASGGNPVVFGPDGNIYGSIDSGGANNTGAIWRATLSGTMEIVASFPATEMKQPETLMVAGDGNLYGTTPTNFVYRFNPVTNALDAVYHFGGALVEPHCQCQLIHGSDGKFYGITPVGGNFPGIGEIFSLNLGIGKPKPVVNQVQPGAGAVGSQVLLFGGWLLGPTSITFNGVPAATFTATSSQSVIVTVPAGASTGPIVVTTPGGSFTTVDFVVN